MPRAWRAWDKRVGIQGRDSLIRVQRAVDDLELLGVIDAVFDARPWRVLLHFLYLSFSLVVAGLLWVAGEKGRRVGSGPFKLQEERAEPGTGGRRVPASEGIIHASAALRRLSAGLRR